MTAAVLCVQTVHDGRIFGLRLVCDLDYPERVSYLLLCGTVREKVNVSIAGLTEFAVATSTCSRRK